MVPHPFCSFRSGSALYCDTLISLAMDVEITEGFNARTLRNKENRPARESVERHCRPISVGPIPPSRMIWGGTGWYWNPSSRMKTDEGPQIGHGLVPNSRADPF